MYNSPTMVASVEWIMRMGSSVWFLSLTCNIVQLTHYNFQSKMEHVNGIISMITITTMLQGATYPLQLQGQGHWIISMLTVMSIPPCTTHQLWLSVQINNGHWIINIITITNMPEQTAHLLWFQKGMMMNGFGIISLMVVTNIHNAQLTLYGCNSRMKNGHRTISMVTVANLPPCTTYLLLFSGNEK